MEEAVNEFATDKQVNFIEILASERMFLGSDEAVSRAKDDITTMIARHRAGDKMPYHIARGLIDKLVVHPKAEQEETEPLTAGVYQKNGEVFVVKPNQERTHLYAKRLVPFEGERLTSSGETVKFEFEYARGAIRTLRLSDKMPLDEARKLMIEYGRCICCNRQLKDATSVSLGIGPVCRKQFA